MKPSSESIIFDLDGTLWDATIPAAVAWNNVIERHGIIHRQITAHDIGSVAGKPHEECIRIIFPDAQESQIQLLCDETMAEEAKILKQHNGVLYPGVLSGLAKLAEQFQLYIVSNCPAGYIENFLQQNALNSLFIDYECWGNTNASKPDNTRSVMQRNHIENAVFVGDTVSDYEAARSNSLKFIQVTYGFGEPIKQCEQVCSFDELVFSMLKLAHSSAIES